MAKPRRRRRLPRAAARSLARRKPRWVLVRAGERAGSADHRVTACWRVVSCAPRYRKDGSSWLSCQAPAASASWPCTIQLAWSSSSHPRSRGQARSSTSWESCAVSPSRTASRSAANASSTASMPERAAPGSPAYRSSRVTGRRASPPSRLATVMRRSTSRAIACCPAGKVW